MQGMCRSPARVGLLADVGVEPVLSNFEPESLASERGGLAREFGLPRPETQKNAPQRLQRVSLTLGNVAYFRELDMPLRDRTAWLGI